MSNIFRSLRTMTPLEKVTEAVHGLSLATSLAKKLIGVGASANTAATIGTQKQDNLTSGSSNEFFMSVAPERATAAQITNNRLPPDGGQPFEIASTGGLRMYPPDLGEYFMMFQFYEYQRPSPFSQPTLKALDQMALPIPSRLVENHVSRWEQKEAGILGDIADIVNHSMNGGDAASATGTAEGAGARGGIVATRALITGTIGKRLALAKLLPGDLDKHFGQTVGSIMNPHLTQFFEGPSFQEHAFQWTFHPRTPSESEQLKEMCKAFKRLMLPSRSIQDVNSFLAYPSMVQVSLHPGVLQEMYPFKRCAVTGVNIDYAPFGQLMTFKGTKAPRHIQFGLTLKAIEYFLSEDFGGQAKYNNADAFAQDVGGKLDKAFETGKQIGTEILGDVGKMIFGGD